jgi:hypothetical protein
MFEIILLYDFCFSVKDNRRISQYLFYKAFLQSRIFGIFLEKVCLSYGAGGGTFKTALQDTVYRSLFF